MRGTNLRLVGVQRIPATARSGLVRVEVVTVLLPLLLLLLLLLLLERGRVVLGQGNEGIAILKSVRI